MLVSYSVMNYTNFLIPLSGAPGSAWWNDLQWSPVYPKSEATNVGCFFEMRR